MIVFCPLNGFKKHKILKFVEIEKKKLEKGLYDKKFDLNSLDADKSVCEYELFGDNNHSKKNFFHCQKTSDFALLSE